MNKAQLYLDKIEADFLRSEFQCEAEIKITCRNPIGQYIVSHVKKSSTPKEPKPIKGKVLTTVILPNVDHLNLNRHYLYFTVEGQKQINNFLRPMMWAKAMIWIATAINQGQTAQFGIHQFAYRHKIRGNAQNLEHLKKMTYRNEIYSFQNALEKTEDLVNLHYKKI